MNAMAGYGLSAAFARRLRFQPRVIFRIGIPYIIPTLADENYYYSFFVLLLTAYEPLALGRDFVWGIPVEGVKAGVTHWPLSGPGNCVVVICIAKAATITNTLVLPVDFNQRIECILRGTNSLPVKKTKEGQQYGAKLQTSMPHQKQINNSIKDRSLGSDPEQLAFFEIDKTFIIKEDGPYELEIRPRLLKETTNGLVPVIFSSIKIKLSLVANAHGD